MRDLKENWYMYVSPTLICIGLAFAFWGSSNDGYRDIGLWLSGSAASFGYFFHSRKIESFKTSYHFFEKFNARFRAIESDLHKIGIESSLPLSREQRSILETYFDLCGEEYLLYKKGLVHSDVWNTWEDGMKTYLIGSKVISRVWGQSRVSGTYYGLSSLFVPESSIGSNLEDAA